MVTIPDESGGLLLEPHCSIMATSLPRNDYLLNRDYTASIRLNAQHYIWQQELHFKLHPIIPRPKEGTRIADVAAGTGVWLLEVARDFPHTQCDGFDISLAQCPHKKWLPSNVDFQTWNFFEEPREDMIGKYDVVHVRLVTVVIRTDPVPVIKNLAKLLKPHDYLQWDEVDFTDMSVAKVDDTVKADGMTRMDHLMTRSATQSWVSRLPQLLSEHGFQRTLAHRVRPEMSLVKSYTALHLLGWAEFASNQPEGSEQKANFTQMVAEAFEESRQGAAHAVGKVIIVAEKKA